MAVAPGAGTRVTSTMLALCHAARAIYVGDITTRATACGTVEPGGAEAQARGGRRHKGEPCGPPASALSSPWTFWLAAHAWQANRLPRRPPLPSLSPCGRYVAAADPLPLHWTRGGDERPSRLPVGLPTLSPPGPTHHSRTAPLLSTGRLPAGGPAPSPRPCPPLVGLPPLSRTLPISRSPAADSSPEPKSVCFFIQWQCAVGPLKEKRRAVSSPRSFTCVALSVACLQKRGPPVRPSLSIHN